MLRCLTTIILITLAYLLVFALGYLGFVSLKLNYLGWFLLITAVSFGLGGPYLIHSNLQNNTVRRQEVGNHSFWLILPGFLVVFYASPLEFLILAEILPRGVWMQIIGLLVVLVSLLLHFWARSALKGLYSGRLWVRDGHTLVHQGPYHFMCHPAYAAYILLCAGIAIAYSSLIGLIAIPLLLLPGLVYRMNVEERLLCAEFGEDYIHYALKTKRLIPGLW